MESNGFTKPEIESALIEVHSEYGSLIHRKAADALRAALRFRHSRPSGHVLASRLFGELAGTFETYAAWALALRARSEPGSFLDSYLGYSNRDVGAFYALVRDHEGDLSDLLRLPPEEAIVQLARSRNDRISEDEYREGLRSQYGRLKEVSADYFKEDRLLIDTYNKTKHGAPMLRLFEPDNPREFEVVMPNRRAGRSGEPPYRFTGFTVDRDEVKKWHNNVSRITEAIQDLAGLTKLLHDAGVLFEDGGDGPQNPSDPSKER